MLNGWSRTMIGGKAADVFDPPRKPRFGLVFLHGVGMETLADDAVFTNLLAKHDLACVAPYGQRSWWLNRVCAEFDPSLTAERHLLDGVVPFFDVRWRLRPRSLGVFGISMGGQGALRLAFRHPQVFPSAAGIASAIDFHEWYGSGFTLDDMFDSKEQARQDTATMWVPPVDYPPNIYFCVDPEDGDWHRGNDRLHEKLNALGVPHVADLTTTGGGHSWDYFDRMAEPVLRFLCEAMEKESRRLL